MPLGLHPLPQIFRAVDAIPDHPRAGTAAAKLGPSICWASCGLLAIDLRAREHLPKFLYGRMCRKMGMIPDVFVW